MVTVIDGSVDCLDFMGQYICSTASNLSGSQIAKRPIDGSAPAQVVSDMAVTCFCVYGEQFVISTAESFDAAPDESGGVLLCDADGNTVRRLLGESVSRMALAGDILIAETKDHRVLAVDIESGETKQLDDFMFEMY